jgi:hypothetical protein
MVVLATLAARGAAIVVTLIAPAGSDTLASITPRYTVRASGASAQERPLLLRLQIATTPGFVLPLVDTVASGDSATFTIRRPLPSNVLVYARASATSALGETVFSETAPVRRTPVWLTLVSPNAPSGTTLESSRPRFTWRSAAVDPPVGPWHYEFRIESSGTRQPIFRLPTTDTTIVLPVPLEVNTSYRWAVAATLATGDSVVVGSLGSFVLVDAGKPLATLLYQNFPNPFPSASSTDTCVWFDLRDDADTRLQVLDLRGNLVRTLIPSALIGPYLASGRYGRRPLPGQIGCNSDIRWDGRDERGRAVSAGIYLLRLRAGTVESVRRIVFLGV